LSDADLRRLIALPIAVKPRRANGLTGHRHDDSTACGLYYFEEVRQQLVSMFGEDQVLEGGLRVYTTYDPAAQLAAERAIRVRLAQLGKPALQGALVAMEPRTGHVIALVGGRDFHSSSFNRVTQAHRQPGSAFKPFVFAAAIERGWAPGSMLTALDAPIGDGSWMPGGGHEAETYSLRRALTVSSNRAAAQLMQQVGLSSTLYTARRMGIESELPAVPSLALGTGEVTLMEMTSAYGAFANEGVWTRPAMITRVEDQSGAVIWTAPFDQRRALSTGAAYLMNSMLADVVNQGTGWRARQLGFSLPAAGKTGTSDDYADSWFIGYTPSVVAGVWFGYDQRRTIARGGYASEIAVPAWSTFMRAATRGDKPVWYEMPSDVEKVEICRASGHRAGEACRRSPGVMRVMLLDGSVVDRPIEGGGITTELFTRGSAPYGECPLHSGLYLDTSYTDLLAPPATGDYGYDAALASSPLYSAAAAVGTSGTEPAPSLVPVSAPAPSTLPGASPNAAPPSLGSLGSLPALRNRTLPATPMRQLPGVKIERIARPDGTIVTVIRKQ
jgi:penicillin-binding protein 1A